MLMAAPFKGRVQPGPNYRQGRFQAHHPLPQRKHVRVIVLASKSRRLNIPAQSTADSADTIRRNRFAISRSAQHDSSLTVAPSHSFCHRSDKQGIVYRLDRIGAEVRDRVTEILQHFADLAFVLEPGMI
jgi:hypothetical protein